VWIEFLRGKGAVVGELERLLDADEVALAASIRLELLSGASRKDERFATRAFRAAAPLCPTLAFGPN
jgi:hypothetical protein